MVYRCAILLAASLMFGFSTPSFALVTEVVSYLRQYQFGFDYANSSDHMALSYDLERAGSAPKGCVADAKNADHIICTVGTVAGQSSGFGIVLEQAFKRQGFFYFKPDIGFGVRYLTADLAKEDLGYQQAGSLPLKSVNAQLLAFVMKPYIQFGITPASTWPDILFSLGPNFQIAAGKGKINNVKENVAFATSSRGLIGGFFAFEIVPWRFGNGALSLFSNFDHSGDGRGSKFFKKDVDGMTDIRAKFSRNVSGAAFGFGLKVLLP